MNTPRIINVRGTSGSGKSTLVTRIASYYSTRTPFKVEGRKQPLYYLLSGPVNHPNPGRGDRPLALLGHYESPCGGCDTIGKWIPGHVEPRIIDGEEPNSYHLTFGLVRSLFAQGYDVLFEGLLLSGDVRHTRTLHEDGLPVSVVCINLPIEKCIDSVISRRLAAGNHKPFNEKNTREKHKLLNTCITKLKAAGLDVRDREHREQALADVATLLGILA